MLSPIIRTALLVALGLSPLLVGACGSSNGQPCPGGCPATYATANVALITTPEMAVNGVQATLTGPVNGNMSCQPNGTATLCTWPGATPVMAGAYSLQVSAPGYQTTTTSVEVTISPPTCGCTAASVEPSTVSLTPADAGTD